MALVDLTKVTNEKSEYSLIPDGTYTFSCIEAKLKATKNGSGKFIEITLECQDKEHLKRRVWARFNIQNASTKAEMIGKKELKRYLEVAGKDTESLTDVNELLGTTVSAVIGSEHTPPYSAQNIVKKWLKAEAF